MRLGFEIIREGCELRRLAVTMHERLCEQPIGQPGVPRQEGAVEIRPDRRPDAAALPAALAVVAEPGNDAAEWLCFRIQACPSRVILEARKRAADTGLELALEQNVADHAPVAGDRVEGEEADPGQVSTVKVAVGAAEELVATADREQCGAARNRRAHALGLRNEVLCDERLFAVLAAADVEKVVLAR